MSIVPRDWNEPDDDLQGNPRAERNRMLRYIDDLEDEVERLREVLRSGVQRAANDSH